jgi:hypothetical protein
MWDPHSAFDTVIQSSTVDLFHACSVAVAPLARSTATVKALGAERLVGTMHFSSASMTGTFTLSVPKAVFAAAKHEGPRDPRPADWIREQTNQLLGRIKKRLTQLQVMLHTGLPFIPSPEALLRLQTSNKPARVYEFRALRGEVIVVLDATIDYSALQYSGSLELATEGDIILF